MTWDTGLESAFYPKVVAMVGVSASAKRSDPWSPPTGASFIRSYEDLGFRGNIYPVNPNATEILGYKTYPSVSSIPEPVDLVVVCVPAKAVPEVLEDCIKANTMNVQIFTSGFEETGEPDAIELGKKVRQIATDGNLRVIGPNCMGIYVPDAGIGNFDRLSTESGSVAFISQSGGHCNWYSHYGPNYGIRFSKVISFGNAYVLDSTDFLDYIADDPQTEIVCMYLEGIKDGRKLLKQVKEINRKKPVLLWKAGLTESGARAVSSHTASLAGQESIWHGFFAQTGAVSIDSLEEMAEMAMTFLHVKPISGRGVAIVALGGGTSVASADTCNREGLDVPALTEETQNKLKEFISLAGASVKNPMDTGRMFGNVTLLQKELELVLDDPQIDMLIIMPHIDWAIPSGPEEVDRLVNFLADFAKNNPYNKPVVIVFHSFANDPREGELRARLQIEFPNKGVAVYRSLAKASRALAKFSAYHRFLSQPE
ncbi:acetate--CoA ligase family protein [Chloroflexota bacterium]